MPERNNNQLLLPRKVFPPQLCYIICSEFHRRNKVSPTMTQACLLCTHSHALVYVSGSLLLRRAPFLSYLCMSSLHTAPFLNSCLSAFPPPSVSPWRWGPSSVSWVSCEHRREGRDAFHRQRWNRAGEPWQQGETQTQQHTTPNRKSHSTYLSDTRLTALS